MARPLDPYRTLELPRDATLDDVKAAYRRLAKLYHPDSAGERALPRFLAVQAAYESLTEGPGRLRATIGPRPRTSGPAARPPGAGRSTGARSASGRAPYGPWPADAAGPRGGPRPGARTGSQGWSSAPGGPSGGARTGRADGARDGRADGARGGRADAAAGGSPGGWPGSSRARGTAGPRPRRTKRAPGSTSYDGAESEPFEPEWEGASWYGGSSGTYWTINPREFADPRKHGPEYLARGRSDGRAPRRRAPDVDGRTAAGAGIDRADAANPGSASGAGLGAATDERGARHSDPEGAAVHDPSWSRTASAGSSSEPADPWSGWPGRPDRSDLSLFGLVALALFALALVAIALAALALPASDGAGWLVPVVAFCGIVLVGVVRRLRGDGSPRT